MFVYFFGIDEIKSYPLFHIKCLDWNNFLLFHIYKKWNTSKNMVDVRELAIKSDPKHSLNSFVSLITPWKFTLNINLTNSQGCTFSVKSSTVKISSGIKDSITKTTYKVI